MKTGGPAVLVYGWLIVGLFSLIISAVLAEICSTYPVTGSVYYWAGALAKREKSAFYSFLTGWVYFFAYVAMMSSFAYGGAKLILGLFEASVHDPLHPSFHANEFHKVLLSILILAVWCH